MKAGWQLLRLGAVCEFDKSQGIHAGLPYVGLEDIESQTARFIGSEEPQVVKSSTFKFSTQHVLYGRLRPYLNKVLAPEFTGHCSTEIFPIKPSPALSREYLLYWFLSDETVGRINATCTGARMPRADMNEVLDFDFPFPPLPEQQRIVTLLDEAFDGIATAKANAGKNLQNARGIFESHLQSVFTQRGDGWIDRSLGELAVFRNGINFTKSSAGEPIKILGVKDFRSSYWAPLEDLETVIPDGALGDLDMLQRDDLVFVRSNGNPELIGRCLLVGEVTEKTTHSGFTIRARLNGSQLIPTYLCHFLKSNIVRREMIDGGNGANIRSLNQGTLSRLVIPVPPTSAQAQIVSQLEDIDRVTKRLETIYQQKLTALDELKKSLLHRAFSGRL